MKRLDAKWDQIIVDRVFLAAVILAIIFTGITCLAIDAGRLEFRVNDVRRVITPDSAPTVFWSSIAALSFIAMCCAGLAVWRFKARKAQVESAREGA